MTKKFMISVIAILSSISLVSIGFASWTIASGNSTIGGIITAEDVMYTDHYVTITKAKPLTYCSKGFVNPDNQSEILNKGSLDLNVTLRNLKEFKTKFSTSTSKIDSLGVDINLSYEQQGTYQYLFNTDSSKELVFDQGKITSSDSSFTLPTTYTKNTAQYTSSSFIPLNGLLNGSRDTYTFNVKYTFTHNSSINESNFKTKLLDTFKKPNLFKVNVRLEGSAGGNK